MSDSDTPVNTGNFAKGLILDPPSHMVSSARRLIGLATPLPKGSVNQFAPPIRDQGQKSQCTGEGSMGAFVTSCNAHGIKLAIPPAMGGTSPVTSPAWAYKVARAVDRTNPNIPLTDDGAMPNQVVRGIQEFGILALGDCSDEDADVNQEPTILELEKASRIHALGWNSIQSSGRDLVLDIMRAIGNAQVAVPASCDVDQAFEDYNGKGIIPSVLAGQNYGGHFFYFSQFQTTASGSILFRFRNSWTEGWGDQGTGWVDDQFIMTRLTSKFTASAIIRGAV